MSLQEFMDRERLKNMAAQTMKEDYGLEPREEILDPVADDLIALLKDVINVLRDFKDDKKQGSLMVFDVLMRAIIAQNILIELMSEKLRNKDG